MLRAYEYIGHGFCPPDTRNFIGDLDAELRKTQPSHSCCGLSLRIIRSRQIHSTQQPKPSDPLDATKRSRQNHLTQQQ
ncbi:hypothetical protein TNCV_4057001 [Trichonephila clavipes]|nr:hypothetical protein TNCV_4057001 [Trichonephila clavipes]